MPVKVPNPRMGCVALSRLRPFIFTQGGSLSVVGTVVSHVKVVGLIPRPWAFVLCESVCLCGFSEAAAPSPRGPETLAEGLLVGGRQHKSELLAVQDVTPRPPESKMAAHLFPL